MIAFGPVPSRRLGRSLGVNNIRPKRCSYSCVYCQIGRTERVELSRRSFYPLEVLIDGVTRKVQECAAAGEKIDFITFVPDGEPTLDARLGAELRSLRRLGIRLAVITNSSLIDRRDVRADLYEADLVSVKVDSVHSEVWRRINRPHGALELGAILEGISEFAAGFRGRLLTETMLVSGLNDGAEGIEELTGFLAGLELDRAYLAVPTRPPAESDVRPPDPESLVRAYRIMRERLSRVELLVTDEEGRFGGSGDPTENLLAILAVHPMRAEAVSAFLAEHDVEQELLQQLLGSEQVSQVEYGGETFFIRSFR